MVRALGHSSFFVMMALTLVPSMPTRPIYAASPQSVQYSHLGMRENKGYRKNGRKDNISYNSIVIVVNCVSGAACAISVNVYSDYKGISVQF